MGQSDPRGKYQGRVEDGIVPRRRSYAERRGLRRFKDSAALRPRPGMCRGYFITSVFGVPASIILMA
jgi:hypothetical protein